MRALIAIGCNAYENASPLDGAEGDATRIYEALLRPDVGEYDPANSALLLSPNYEEVRLAIRTILFGGEKIDTFTFFFAGHGGVKSGSFYMLLRDSRLDALSASALSLSDFFLNLNESAPSQSNIIIDACEGGGLIADLGVLLKSDLIGDSGTPGITLLATSAQNQESSETTLGGLGTNAILDCIEGREFIQDINSALDLVEIGRAVSTRLRRESDQTPVVWGLNLYGPPRFCRNARFASDTATSLRGVLQAWPASSDISINAHYDELWKVYASASGSWNARSFAQAIDPILSSLRSSPQAMAGFIDRLGTALFERAALSDDAYRPAQVGAAFASCLLKDIEVEAVGRQIDVLLTSVGEAITRASKALADQLDENPYALLAGRGGLADLFYLPERVAKVLGWAAAGGMIAPVGTNERTAANTQLGRLFQHVLGRYFGSVTPMSDAQASCWAVALSHGASIGLRNEAEQIAGLLYHGLTECAGQVARADISAEDVLNYLLMRAAGRFEEYPGLIGRPNLTTTVLLRAARLLELEDILDEHLWQLDGVTCTAYLNPNLELFGDEEMEGGANLVWGIGLDLFRTSELAATWRADLEPENPSRLLWTGAALASLVYPDRVAWYLLDQPS